MKLNSWTIFNGTKSSAIYFSIQQTARANGFDPKAFVVMLLEKLRPTSTILQQLFNAYQSLIENSFWQQVQIIYNLGVNPSWQMEPSSVHFFIVILLLEYFLYNCPTFS